MKRATAVKHLAEMADEASQRRELLQEMSWPLTELWTAGEVLTLADDLDVGTVVLVIDAPPEEMPWLAIHPDGELVGELLRAGKRPQRWWYRPAAWPAWNQAERRVVRFWSADAGTDEPALDALRQRRLDRLDVVVPTDTELRDQLGVELAVSRAHLRGIVDNYWERDWRRSCRGTGNHPEDHLWRAAQAVADIEDALGVLA